MNFKKESACLNRGFSMFSVLIWNGMMDEGECEWLMSGTQCESMNLKHEWYS